ncbi:MAG: HAMP domain-containing sensor histidine kinase [Kofleriaceae bacterium]
MTQPQRAGRPPTDGDGAADEELRKKKRVLAALVVHDLRSPLSAASGYLELLREELRAAGSGAPDAERVGGYLDDTRTLIDKALGLVATILDVDELEDGILRARPTRVRLRDTLEPARASSRASFQMRQLRFDDQVPPDLEVDLDRELFARVLENLIDNAARYAPRAGRVAVGATLADGQLEIYVGNDGPAVPAAERETIFGRFYQVEARRASARANRGLGLYFCRLAAEAHGGSIAVEERVGLPCVFVLRMPQPPAA